MDTRRIAIYAGRTRVGLGLAMLAAPRAVLQPWLGGTLGRPAGTSVTRFLGAREAVLGAGTAIAAGERNGGGSWTSMAAVADGVDAIVCLVTPGLPRSARILGVLAAGSAAAHLVLARRVAADELATD
jgi:hypothetical protein